MSNATLDDGAKSTCEETIAALNSAIKQAEKSAASITDNVASAKTALKDLSAFVGSSSTGTEAEALKSSAKALKIAAQLINISTMESAVGNRLDEWKECRSTIDRCDKLIVDLRKTGFGFLTALVGAATFFFSVPNPPATGASAATAATTWAGTAATTLAVSAEAKSSFACMLVLLVVALYVVDLTHQTWLKTAVDQAVSLEKALKFELTQKISVNFGAAWAVALGLVLYSVLLFAVCGVLWFAVPGAISDISGRARLTILVAFAVGQIALLFTTFVWRKQWGATRCLFGISLWAIVVLICNSLNSNA